MTSTIPASVDPVGMSASPNWPRLGGDLTAATIAASLVSPTVAIIGRKPPRTSPSRKACALTPATALTHPQAFLLSRPHGHVFALYAATYTVANTTETIAQQTHPSLSSALTFACTFLVDVPLGVWKDLRFAQLFGTHSHQRPLPTTKKALPIPKKTGSTAATTALLIRDALTIYGSFALAQRCTEIIPDSLAAHPYSKTVFTQLVVPVLSQLAATPLHLLGLDLYNRKHRVPWGERAAVVRRDLPACGDGGPVCADCAGVWVWVFGEYGIARGHACWCLNLGCS
ncbi:hypothetical protein BDW62DRAFT_206985 [Aspergillus aurantiobrunneus]